MDVKAILEEQKALQLLMSEFAKAEGDERSALEEAIAAQAAKIEAMGEVLSDEVSASYPDADESEAVIEVELSAAQRQRVFEQTGVDRMRRSWRPPRRPWKKSSRVMVVISCCYSRIS